MGSRRLSLLRPTSESLDIKLVHWVGRDVHFEDECGQSLVDGGLTNKKTLVCMSYNN